MRKSHSLHTQMIKIIAQKENKMTKRIYLCLLWTAIICTFPFHIYAAETEKVIIKEALDGDTVVLEDGRRVRYLGINTTEWQEPFSLKAKRRNKALANNRKAKLEFDTRKFDSYGRLLAYIYVNNEMVNSKLVKEGLAHVLIIPPNRKYSKLLLELQEKAKGYTNSVFKQCQKPQAQSKNY